MLPAMHVLPAAALSDARILAAYIIFLASYLVFALGKFPGLKIDRPGAAIIGAVAMVGFRIVRPAEALRFIDFGTIVLLFSMMLIVGNLHLVGFFEWERGSRPEKDAATIPFARRDFHLWNPFRIFCKRHRVPRHGSVRAQHHQANESAAAPVLARGGHQLKHRQRRDHYR
jgi:hypothetical protein